MSKLYSQQHGLKWFCSIVLFALFLTVLAPATTSHAAATTSQATIKRHFLYGAWLGGLPTTTNIADYELQSGRHLNVGHFFIDWATDFSSILPTVELLDQHHSQVMITWEPWQYNTQQIASGQADAYIRNFAREVKSYGDTIQLRPLHEMNGNWYPWAIGDSTINTNASYIKAWRHTVDIFRQERAYNTQFVWAINAASVGAGASFTGAYPGNDFVDYVGMDGYNWGTTQSWGSTWQTFDQIFSSSYQALTTLTKKPILIPEWASAEQGGNKAAWITDAFQQLASSKYSQVVGAYWFNMNKETDWRITSSPAALQAFQTAIHDND